MTVAKTDELDFGSRSAYVPPRLQRFGSATELTKQRTMSGAMDGGANNSRSQ